MALVVSRHRLVGSSSPWPSTRSYKTPAVSLRSPIQAASITAPYFSMTVSALDPPQAVRCFLTSLIDGLRRVGLEIKSGIIPLCT